MKIGICGTGRMGTAMGLHLMESGHEVHCWNRTPENAGNLIEKGAVLEETPAQLAANVEVIIAILLNDESLQSLYHGNEGLLSEDLSNKGLIEMSTVRPDTIRALGENALAKGAAFIECPVSGTVGPAREGKLFGLAGGSKEHFDQLAPVLDTLCRRFEYVGPLGAGAHMKLAVNLPLIVYWQALGEAMSLADAAGIDLELAASILSDTSGTAKAGPARIPSIVCSVQGDIPDGVMFTIAGMAKDLGLMIDTAEKNGFSAPAAAAARNTYDKATEDGWGHRDGTLAAAWRILANRS